MEYLGNCINSFDKDTGESLIPGFVDVSDFAKQDEEAEVVNSKSIGTIPPAVSKATGDHPLAYLKYSGGVVAIYDMETDIHYFFKG
jgi:hypothetical protein